MSPLTKLFVVLLVVLSLVLTAATVVFVNQVDDFKKAADQANQRLTAANNEKERVRTESETTRANAEAAIAEANRQVGDAKQELNKKNQDLVAKDAELSKATLQTQIQTVSITSLTGALKGSEDTKSALQNQVTELRSNSDKLVMQNAQLNQTVTDLTNRLDVTERERKLLSEQLVEAKGQVEKQSGMLRDLGVSPAQLASAGTRLSAPPINGVIRGVKPIYGIQYATISVGSADNVVKGMTFQVVSHDTGAFLGVLTVDTVEQNESTGRLTGPRVGEIHTGAEVKTQL